MSNRIEIRTAGNSYKDDIVGLLRSENLPVADLQTDLQNFFVACIDDAVVGVVGLEQYGSYGLLRSLIIHPSYRNQHLAADLIGVIENRANDLGINCIYLLTETAPLYFEKKGYSQTDRNEVPLILQQSTEFSHICPSSAIAMKKSLV